MGLELYVQWFSNGIPALVPYESVRAAFGESARPQEPEGFKVVYGPTDESFIYVRATDEVSSLMVSRPCTAIALFDAVVHLLNLGNGLCIWPGGGPAVASHQALPHLPSGIPGTPHVAPNGAALLRLVGAS